MKLSTLVLAAAAAAPVIHACKCILPHGLPNVDFTLKCCYLQKGESTQDDCVAHSIKNHLSQFYDCCQSMGRNIKITSDCPCSAGCKGKLPWSSKRQFFPSLG